MELGTATGGSLAKTFAGALGTAVSIAAAGWMLKTYAGEWVGTCQQKTIYPIPKRGPVPPFGKPHADAWLACLTFRRQQIPRPHHLPHPLFRSEQPLTARLGPGNWGLAVVMPWTQNSRSTAPWWP